MKKLLGKYFDDIGLFFRQDESGCDLFYPWGYPGDAIHIDRTHKASIYAYILAIFFGSLIYIFIQPRLFDPFDFAGKNWADTWFSFFVPASYFLLCWMLLKKRGSYMPKYPDPKPRTFRIVYVIWFVIFIQSGTIFNALSSKELSFKYICFLAMGVPYTAFLIHFAILLPKRNGCYFTRSNKKLNN